MYKTWILLVVATFALSLAADASGQASASQLTKPGKAMILEKGKPIERQIATGQTNLFKIRARARHVVSGVVDQRGVDVLVRVINPRGAADQIANSLYRMTPICGRIKMLSCFRSMAWDGISYVLGLRRM